MRRSFLRSTAHRSICLAVLIATWVGSQVRAAEDPDEQVVTIEVRLVDGDGKAVEGAYAGILAGVGDAVRKGAARRGTEWAYGNRATSDAHGVARVSAKRRVLNQTGLVVRHEGRKISAIVNVDPSQSKQSIQLTLLPERVVVGETTCPTLALAAINTSSLVVYISIGESAALQCGFDQSQFRIPLPPGKFTLSAYSGGTYKTSQEIVVASGSGEQRIEPVPLRPTEWALLVGKPAPEIPGVVAWKNSPPIKLADLRGKVVLLDFWGYWCGPCINKMPELLDLYDKYHDRGLEVIGVHVDQGEDEPTAIDTVAKLDARLATIRKGPWKGRDLPFPVALTVGQPTPFPENPNEQARSPASARFGIDRVPRAILIDRQGLVVGLVREFNEKEMTLLDETLTEK